MRAPVPDPVSKRQVDKHLRPVIAKWWRIVKPFMPFKEFEVKYVRGPKALGYYQLGSFRRPVILLDVPRIRAAAKRRGERFSTKIMLVFLHELYHAVQEHDGLLTGTGQDEKEAHRFAERLYHKRELTLSRR